MDRPILFLPKRETNPQVPSGWTAVLINEEAFEANFVKVAVNVVRKVRSTGNALPDILRGWFGEDAGQPGTNHMVVFEFSSGQWTLAPVTDEVSAALEVGQSYMREKLPPAFGIEFKRNVWQQGFVQQDADIFLLVTLDKSGMRTEHRYGDRFLARDLFEWKSQNRHTQKSSAGQSMRDHKNRGIRVHLLVRKTGKIGAKAAPFIYCGEVDFVDWEGERPITVRWKLRNPLPARVATLFEVS